MSISLWYEVVLPVSLQPVFFTKVKAFWGPLMMDLNGKTVEDKSIENAKDGFIFEAKCVRECLMKGNVQTVGFNITFLQLSEILKCGG